MSESLAKESTTEIVDGTCDPNSAGHAVPANIDARAGILDYISIARPDHWFKNVFMVFGIVLAYFYQPNAVLNMNLGMLVWAFVATCLVASSNYVINEILDAATDRSHPTKRYRPIPSGRVRMPLAYLEWLVLGAIGLAMAWMVNTSFFVAAALLWIMGMVYNIRPIRSKELPYLDVVSESVNNPLRLALGWFVVSSVMIPPMSLIVSYWMAGAFFMASKRFAEYRSIGDPGQAAAYRHSFRYYDDDRLLISMFFYATAAALLLGVFIIRYHLELILSVPLIAGFFSYYLFITLKPDSPAQAPEKLYREKGLMLYLVVCVAAFILLMFIRVNVLYDWFNVVPSDLPPLWEI
ncbi:MAG: UbiA prenyltransferase family protein [Planctomycetes bacterium]|nr:UbiA prenyltransferase family protein [Planctomycetota bacterium]